LRSSVSHETNEQGKLEKGNEKEKVKKRKVEGTKDFLGNRKGKEKGE